MADVKWIKIVTDIFDDEKIKLIEKMPEADTLLVIWFKILCLAGKTNRGGLLMLSDKIYYTDEMLSGLFSRPLTTVRLALKTFQDFGMIELINDTYFIANWDKHQNVETLDKVREQTRMRVQKYRQKLIDSNVTCNVTVTDSNAREEEREEERDIDKRIGTNKFVERWNSLGLNKVLSIKNNRLKSLKARIEEFGEDKVLEAISNITQSSFLQGQNDRGWKIDIDWLLKPNNFPKVLEGNYKDSPKSQKGTGFNNFKPRDYDYDYDSLEKKLLGWDEDD